MNNKENEQSKIKDQETFIKIYYNVRRCKGLDWEEKAILSNYISYQMNNNDFYQTDSYQARELGLSTAQISKYTSRLKERGEIDTEMKYEVNPTGGRPIPVRYVKVLNIDKWTKDEVIPVVKKIISATQKKKAKEMAEVKADQKMPASAIEFSEPSKEKEVKIIQPAIQKAKKETPSTKRNSADISDLITLDGDKDIDNSITIGRILIAKIKNKENIEFKKVQVKFGSDIFADEATLLENGSGKHYLKSSLKVIDASVFG